MVQRTAGGIRYDTNVRSGGGSSSSSSGSSGSGSEKLAAFKERAAARASPGETPEQYRKRVTSPTQPRPVNTPSQSQTPSTDVSPMARAGIQPTQQQQSVIQTPAGFIDIQRRYSPQSGITAADVTQRGQAARADAMQKVKEQEYIAAQQGYEATQGIQLSPVSQKAYDVTQSASEKLRTRGTELKQSGSYVGGYGLTSVGNVVEMAGMIPGGVETIAKRPDVIKPALVTGAISVPVSTATQIKEDPAQLVSDLAVFSALGYSAGKVGGFVKTKTPKITRTTTPQEFLVRTELPTAPKATTEAPKFTQLEYINQVTGKGKVFTEMKEPSVIPRPKAEPTVDVLIGKQTQPGYQEVFFRASAEEAAKFAKTYEGNIRQIRTPEGSAIEFTPTGKRTIQEGGIKPTEQRIGTFEPELIGEVGLKPSKKFELPFRLEKRVQAEPGKISLSPAERMVKDADVFETYATEQLRLDTKKMIGKEPEQFIQIGKRYDVTKQKVQFEDFLKSTEAEVSPRVKAKRKAAQQELIFKQKEEAKPKLTEEELIAQFEKEQSQFLKSEAELFAKKPITTAMQPVTPFTQTFQQKTPITTKLKQPYVEKPPLQRFEIKPTTARRPTTFKEPTTQSPFKSQFEQILKRSQEMDIKALKTPTPARPQMPVFALGIAPTVRAQTSTVPDSRIKQMTGSILSVQPSFDTKRIYDTVPITKPVTKTDTSTESIQTTKPITKPPSKKSTSFEYDFIPPVLETVSFGKKKFKSTKKVTKKSKGKFKDIVNPVAEWESFAKGLMK